MRQRTGPADVLTAAEQDAPTASLDVVARNLRERFGAECVSFLFVDIVDIVGRRMVRVGEETATRQGRRAERIRLSGSSYEDVLRSQELLHAPDDDHGQRILAPVTNRGDTIGVLELHLQDVTEDVLEQVRARPRVPGRHWGRRTTGQLLRIALDGSRAQLRQRRPPCPLRLRDGAVGEVRLNADMPSGARASCSPTAATTSTSTAACSGSTASSRSSPAAESRTAPAWAPSAGWSSGSSIAPHT